MKLFLYLFLVAITPSIGFGITVEELGRLAELKTSEELILKMIEDEQLSKPITASDTIYLKERGLSEEIINYLWKQSFQDKNFLPPQEGESEMIGENLRLYRGIDKNGNKVVVLTNLDESGRRMGPPPPPRVEPPPPPDPVYEPEIPPEIHVTVEFAEPAPSEYLPQTLPEYPPFEEPAIFDSGYYPVYPPLTSFIYYPVRSKHFKQSCFTPRSHGNGTKTSGWNRNGTSQRPFTPVNVHGPVQWPGSTNKRIVSRKH